MDNGLIVPYLDVEDCKRMMEPEPLSGLRWQAEESRDAGRKPEVWGTLGQEKLHVC